MDRDTRRGQGSRVCPQLPGEQPGTLSWVLIFPSHTFSFSVHFTNIIVHQSFIFLSESLVTENKLKIFFQTHCLWTLLTQYEIRLIIHFAARDGEALYSQQKQDQELNCASDHELLIAKFILKLKKLGKTTRPFRYDLNPLQLYSRSEK